MILSVYLRLILIPACDSSSLALCMMYSAYKLNKQGDKIQLYCTSFPILKQSVVPCPVLTAASWSAYRFHAATAKSLRSCPTLRDPIDGSPPGSAVPGILQARTLKWVAISFSSAWKWKWSCSVVPNPQGPHGLQPSRLLRPWDFPGKSSGVGCRCLLRIYERDHFKSVGQVWTVESVVTRQLAIH